MLDPNENESVNPDKKILGRRLKVLRENIGFTLEELSQATKQMDFVKEGVSKMSISRYENGDSFPGYREIKLLSQALGISITFLFYGDTPDPYTGWEFSLDEYLRSVIKDVLIEEGLVEGESRAQRENKKMNALSSLQHRRAPFVLTGDDARESDELRLEKLAKLTALAEKTDREAATEIQKSSKSRKITKKI